MNVIDASRIDSAYENGAFSLDRWKEYIRKAFPPAEALCLDDLEECLKAGLSWENDYLPMLKFLHIRFNPLTCLQYTLFSISIWLCVGSIIFAALRFLCKSSNKD